MKLLTPIWPILLSSILLSCGPSENTGSGKPDQGGDHIPELKVYATSALHERARDTGIRPSQPHTSSLQPLAYFGRRYHLCFDQRSFSENALTSMATLLDSENSDFERSGLTEMTNRVLADAHKLNGAISPFSDRIEILAITVSDAPRLGSAPQCDALILQSSPDQFPFTDSDFAGKATGWFFPTQLRKDGSLSNKIPVGFISSSVSSGTLPYLAQLLAARLLGLVDSGESNSFLNEARLANTDSRTVSSTFGWLVYDSRGYPRATADAQTFAAFALQFSNILSPEDRDRAHFFEDLRLNAQTQTDESIVLPAMSSPPPYKYLYGNPWLAGFRNVSKTVRVCWQEVASPGLSDGEKAELLSFTALRPNRRLYSLLAARDARFLPTTESAEDSCNLIIALRTSDQFPFDTKKLDGLYIHEGSLRAKDGIRTSVPVIYLNASGLAFSQNTATDSRRYAGLVLEHEWAHFLGMRHSESSTSILYPIGANSFWDVEGYDGAMFDEYLAQYSY